MTIDSGWVHVFKEVAPRAFQPTYPHAGGSPHVAYIDGMPLLMVSEASVQSWDDLLRVNFARHVSRYFKLGCRAVVLAFDDYEHVPKAKAITQSNRAKAKAEYEFGEGSQLPPCIPPKFNEKLSNRIFKRRVIDLVCNRVSQHIVLNPAERHARSFVVDYTGCPILFEAPAGAANFEGQRPQFLTDLPPMGEADVKFLRWGQFFGGRSMVAYSVDGDFIPIALMHCESQENGEARWGQHKYEVALYRLKYRPPGGAESSSFSCAKKKNSVDNDERQRRLDAAPTGGKLTLVPAASTAATTAAGDVKKTPPKRHKREWEYVSIPALYRALRDRLAQTFATMARSPAHEQHYMRMVAALIGLAGTDFSRGLPYIGPMTMWNMLSTDRAVFRALLDCYDPAQGVVRAQAACDALASAVYMNKFASHFKKAVVGDFERMMDRTRKKAQLPGSETEGEEDEEDEEEEEQQGFAKIISTLKRSALSERTKGGLPSAARVVSTFRNINWILHYWSCRAPVLRPARAAGEADAEGEASATTMWDYGVCYPDPICKRFGFKYRSVQTTSRATRRKKGRRGAAKRARVAKQGGQHEEEEEHQPKKQQQQQRICAVQWYDDDDGTDDDDDDDDADEDDEDA